MNKKDIRKEVLDHMRDFELALMSRPIDLEKVIAIGNIMATMGVEASVFQNDTESAILRFGNVEWDQEVASIAKAVDETDESLYVSYLMSRDALKQIVYLDEVNKINAELMKVAPEWFRSFDVMELSGDRFSVTINLNNVLFKSMTRAFQGDERIKPYIIVKLELRTTECSFYFTIVDWGTNCIPLVKHQHELFGGLVSLLKSEYQKSRQ